MRVLLSLNSTRVDTPPRATGPIGAASTHQVDNVDPADFGWLVASALASTGVAMKTQAPAEIDLQINSNGKTILVITPRQREESFLRFQMAQHLREPVLLLRGGRDDRAVRLCSLMLQGISMQDSNVISDVVLEGISGLAPESVSSAKQVFSEVHAAHIEEWFTTAGAALRGDFELRPIGTALQRLATALEVGPSQILSELTAILPIEAAGRAMRSTRQALSPTIQRAASYSSGQAEAVLCLPGL